MLSDTCRARAAVLERELDAQEPGVLHGADEVRPEPVRGDWAGAVHVRAVRGWAQDVPREGVREAGDTGVHAPPSDEVQVGDDDS